MKGGGSQGTRGEKPAAEAFGAGGCPTAGERHDVGGMAGVDPRSPPKEDGHATRECPTRDVPKNTRFFCVVLHPLPQRGSRRTTYSKAILFFVSFSLSLSCSVDLLSTLK